MYIEAVPNRGSPPAILLRESFRHNGRVKKRTLANLSDWPTALVEGFRALLKGGIAVAAEGIGIRRALPHGHAASVLGAIRAIGLDSFSPPCPSGIATSRWPSCLISCSSHRHRAAMRMPKLWRDGCGWVAPRAGFDFRLLERLSW